MGSNFDREVTSDSLRVLLIAEKLIPNRDRQSTTRYAANERDKSKLFYSISAVLSTSESKKNHY